MTEEDKEIEENYKRYVLGRPHIVILGAGATMAAIPNGDRNGKRCSVMKGFIENMGLTDLLSSVDFKTDSDNLEEIFSELKNRPECNDIVTELENRIISNFAEFIIPDEPTIYDYLLLSLRSKDYIFSFNWDDLIIQAYQRAWKITHDLPQLVFLHGNIGVGKCPSCGAVEALRNIHCRECGNELARSKILFPIKEKNYGDDPYIKNCWEGFLDILSRATIVTIFGYSAPKSDAMAIEAMQKAFSSTFRKLDQIEVIDLKSEHDLWETWDDFAEPTNFHFKTCRTFFDSILSEFPRRSVEGYWKRNFCNWWGSSGVQLEACRSFDELEAHLTPIIDNELDGNYSIIRQKC